MEAITVVAKNALRISLKVSRRLLVAVVVVAAVTVYLNVGFMVATSINNIATSPVQTMNDIEFIGVTVLWPLVLASVCLGWLVVLLSWMTQMAAIAWRLAAEIVSVVLYYVFSGGLFRAIGLL